MDDQTDLNPVPPMDEENPEAAPVTTSSEQTPAEETSTIEQSMDVDDAAFEDALESISEAPDEPKEVDKDMSVDDQPPQQEELKSPDNDEEANKDEGEQPHAMEIHDVPEHEHHHEPEDPNASVAPSEKSMDVTMLNSSAIDPFDTVKHTSTNDDSVAEKDTSNLNEPSNADSEPEQTNDDVDTTTQDNDENSRDKDDDTSQQKDTEEVADDAVEEIGDGENENLSLLPDFEREITEDEKERARLAQEESEKNDKSVEEEPVDDEPEEPTVDLTEDVEPSKQINYVLDKLSPCFQCKETKACQYRLKENEEPVFFCEQTCVDAFIASNPEAKYVVRRKKYVAEENTSTDEAICNQCDESKVCKYVVQQEDERIYLCEEECLNMLVSEQADRIRVKRVRAKEPAQQTESEVDPEAHKFNARTEEEAEVARVERENSFMRRCAHCTAEIHLDERTLYWEAMDFCNEQCLGQYQNIIGSTCTTCHNAVPLTSLGKYCVRFGFEVRQFCRSECLNEFKKVLKVCSYCQMDIGVDEPGFLAPVGEKGQFKDFCTQTCMKKFEQATTPPNKRRVHNAICAVCELDKPARIQMAIDNKELNLCANSCLSAFKFVNNVETDQCGLCSKHFERKLPDAFTLYPGTTESVVFCTKICMNIYITMNRRIVPCQWCKVKKYDFDMIRKILTNVVMCSLNCVTLCELSSNALHQKRVKCDQCKTVKQSQYHLTMSDASIRNFCTYQCVMAFQSRFSNLPLTLESDAAQAPVPTGLPKRVKKNLNNASTDDLISQKRSKRSAVPVISSVQSLAPGKKQNGHSLMDVRVSLEPLASYSSSDRASSGYKPTYHMPPPPPEPAVEKRVNLIVTPAPLPQIANKVLQTKPATETKAVSCRPAQSSVELQTCKRLERKRTIPIPVPVYVPVPVGMYNVDIPIPVPVPLTIPVPIFVPTNRNSAAGILKEIKKIYEKMPSDPLEAELLMMADYVSGRKCDDDSESDSDEDDGTGGLGQYNNQNAFSEDLVQIALKMASNEYEENNVDLENEMTANTITHQPTQQVYEDPALLQHQQLLMMEQQRQMQTSGRGRKRGAAANRNTQNRAPPAKRIKSEPIHHIPQPEPPREPEIKPDANMCLKYTFGVNAWKQWVLTKNAEIEKSGTKRRPFKNEILQMTADELNYSLCLFVKEVRKPNGSEYAPDTIYYLVLGIQQYLYENGRIDNIFTDPYYERFTDCLDEVARKFSVLYNDSQYIVTRVEEEHLWECKQLGAHSPHVLLSTLMFFNTKHFNLVTPEEHQELSFSHIMKHWKRNPGQGGKGQGHIQGTRNVMLRFYPPQSSLAANSRKKKVYEQSENEENPLRCPVKLYEFYLSKCPESVKTRNDVFYLQPERSCVPDSPVWYSTQPMPKEGICKMLHRVKMVKEINIALLTS